jgi:hypothetical protein
MGAGPALGQQSPALTRELSATQRPYPTTEQLLARPESRLPCQPLDRIRPSVAFRSAIGVHQRIREFLALRSSELKRFGDLRAAPYWPRQKQDGCHPKRSEGWLFVGRGFSRDLK